MVGSHGERKRREWGEKGQRVKIVRGSERKEGANSPFNTKSGICACYQVTVGQSLEGMLTVIRDIPK